MRKVRFYLTSLPHHKRPLYCRLVSSGSSFFDIFLTFSNVEFGVNNEGSISVYTLKIVVLQQLWLWRPQFRNRLCGPDKENVADSNPLVWSEHIDQTSRKNRSKSDLRLNRGGMGQGSTVHSEDVPFSPSSISPFHVTKESLHRYRQYLWCSNDVAMFLKWETVIFEWNKKMKRERKRLLLMKRDEFCLYLTLMIHPR